MASRRLDHPSVNEAYPPDYLGVGDGELQGNVGAPRMSNNDRAVHVSGLNQI